MSRKTTAKSATRHSVVPPKVSAPKITPAKATDIAKPVVADATAPVVATAPEIKTLETKAVETKPVETKIATPVATETAVKQLTEETSAAISHSTETNKVSSLLEALHSTDADIARDAATVLGLAGDASAVAPLIAAIDNVDGYFHPVVRAAAASSLAQLGDVSAVEPLIYAVRDPIGEASAEAIRALATLADGRAISPLIEVVRNYSGYFAPVARLAAVHALAKLGGEQATSELQAVASDTWEDNVIRAAAEEATLQAVATK